VLRTSDGHPLPGVELRMVSPTSMEEGRKAPSTASPLAHYGFSGRLSHGDCRRRVLVAQWKGLVLLSGVASSSRS
jgi:hypothetical protein